MNQTMGSLACLLIFSWALSDINITTGKHDGHRQPRSPPAGQPAGSIFDVMKYGAKGDGKTDDTKAFLAAWLAACPNAGSPTVLVPQGRTFLVSKVQFQGPCKATPTTFQILGTILAPPKQQWRNTEADVWISFRGVNGLRIIGNGQGSINGQGQSWWPSAGENKRPTAMQFARCDNLHLNGLRHINSQRNHVSITGCNHADIYGLHLIAPGTSPNTDGIDISSSTYVYIKNSTMETGDDCIAINGGSSNIFISEVNCGPGHGISVGSLGENGRHEVVETVSVDNCNFHATMNGARIKTWQGGSGFVRNINFTNLNFTATDDIVIIDQFYCPHHNCANRTSAVKISDVHFKGLHGTTTGKTAAIDIRCSSTVPCTSIQFDDVDIRSTNPRTSPTAVCLNTIGTVAHTSSPHLNCSKHSKWDLTSYF